jgi:amino acid transporter
MSTRTKPTEGSTPGGSGGERQDTLLHKGLGYPSLVAIGLGSVIGSGWLFSAMYAAQAAGPAALVAWVIGGIVMLLVALVFAELAIVKPESGGLVRYPLYSNGRLAASIVGWSMWIAYVGNPPTEAAGVVQYANAYIGIEVYNGTRLTTVGVLLAAALMVVFVVVNAFGVAWFARANNVVTVFKLVVPLTTVVTLLIVSFHSSNITGHGGVAPYGWGSALGSIATAGIVFAYTGFRNIVELSGEARNPRKNIPLALITTILFTIVLYLGLQVAFLGAVPGPQLVHGWSGVNFDSPFANLAMLVNLTWLYWMLIADSMVSPSGSGIVYTAANARNVFGLSKNGFFPTWTEKINGRTGVPFRALLVNFVIGVAFLLPLPSWQSIISVTSTLAVFTFAIGSISLLAFRRSGLADSEHRLPFMGVLAPAAFIVSSLVIFWVPWNTTLWKTIPIVAIGLVWYVVSAFVNKDSIDEVKGGIWLVGWLFLEYLFGYLGSYGGKAVLSAPYDSIVVAIVAALVYFWGVESGARYMAGRPEETERLRDEAADDYKAANATTTS